MQKGNIIQKLWKGVVAFSMCALFSVVLIISFIALERNSIPKENADNKERVEEIRITNKFDGDKIPNSLNFNN